MRGALQRAASLGCPWNNLPRHRNPDTPRFFGKNSLPLDVDGLIAQLAGGRTQPMAREVMRMPRLDDYPFHSLRHFKDRYFEAAQTASATVTSIGIWWWRIMEK